MYRCWTENFLLLPLSLEVGENERKQRTVGNGPNGRQGFPGHRQDRAFAALCLRLTSTPFSVLESELGCRTLKGPMQQETERSNSKCTP